MASGEVTESDLNLTDEEAQQLLADAIDSTPEGTDETGEANQGSEGDLGDAGKRALEALRAELKATKAELRQSRAGSKQAQTLQQQVEELRGQLAERDKRDVERSGRLAMSRLDAQLAKAGIERDDVDGLLKRIKGTDLLKDGEPDDSAIGELAESLKKIAGRATPDPDQGAKGGKAPLDMNQLIRRAAGVTS